MRPYFTHIWDTEEKRLYDRFACLLVVPACGAERQSTRNHKLCYLQIPEACLPRGTLEFVACPICREINEDLKLKDLDYEIWDELASL